MRYSGRQQVQYQAEQKCIEEYHRIKQLRNRQHRCPSEHGRDGAEAITQQPGSQQKDGDVREEQSDHPTQQGQKHILRQYLHQQTAFGRSERLAYANLRQTAAHPSQGHAGKIDCRHQQQNHDNQQILHDRPCLVRSDSPHSFNLQFKLRIWLIV